jgi:hypothetical protein
MILCSEDEVNEEDSYKSQDHACEQNLNGQRLSKFWAILEVWVSFWPERQNKIRRERKRKGLYAEEF